MSNDVNEYDTCWNYKLLQSLYFSYLITFQYIIELWVDKKDKIWMLYDIYWMNELNLIIINNNQ